MGLATARMKESVAMMAIGDGTLALLRPESHVALWSRGPDWWRKMLRPFEKSSGLTRAAGIAGIAFGLWLAFGQERRAEEG